MIRMRIAIYSRKSKWTGRGDSVENQVAMCREYISRYVENGSKAEILVYEDEGFSGKNTRRPQFQKMMEAFQMRKFDYLVCYRLDRLGRNLIDLATLVEELNRRRISFISIKEHFDTSTPMGKAMLYFAGVLAQMEREQIAERVRDNMVMLARSGRWLGGNTPLGFFAAEEKMMLLDGRVRKTWHLTENASEIITVRYIFQLYLEKQSLSKVAEYLQLQDIRTRKNNVFTVTAIRDILRNPVYCSADADAYAYFCRLGCQVCMENPSEKSETEGRGLICYAKTNSGHRENPPEKWILAAGTHEGVVIGKNFVKVQQLLEKNKGKGGRCRIRNEIALLSGLLYCSCGQAMRPKYYAAKQTGADGKRRFSYICPQKTYTRGAHCQTPNIQGNKLDEQAAGIVLNYLEENVDWKTVLVQAYESLKKSTETQKTVSETELLNQKQKEKRKQVQNLLHILSEENHTPEFICEIEKEILNLQEQLRQIARETDKKEREKTESRQSDSLSNENSFSSRLTSLEHIFPYFTVLQKREIIRNVLEKITWDGNVITFHFK